MHEHFGRPCNKLKKCNFKIKTTKFKIGKFNFIPVFKF